MSHTRHGRGAELAEHASGSDARRAHYYAVMLECRAGTWRMHGDTWGEDYHVVTWQTEEHYPAAAAALRELEAGDPLRKNIRKGWIEESLTEAS